MRTTVGSELLLLWTLDYTVDEGGWFIGNLRQIPGVISQGKTLDELKANILDALLLMLEDERAQ
ncbi:MAG: type II toxin-antitoxin system HicB family antitoxin [Deltaproteobacteria bacterium]|nr:type II toxin-antitoxin system HicB family antitoxin [Deltaproteobacteria bacterium]